MLYQLPAVIFVLFTFFDDVCHLGFDLHPGGVDDGLRDEYS